MQRTGGSLRLAAPITENLTAQVAYNYKEETFGDDKGVLTYGADGLPIFVNGQPFYSTCANTPVGPLYTLSPIINRAICDSPYSTSSVSYALTYNTLDNQRDPRDGIFAQVGQEVAGLGGDAKFLRTTGRASFFSLLSEEYDVIGQVSGGAGNVTALGDDLRVFDNFFKGQDIVRGFKYQGIGPRQNGVAIGGTNYANATAEVTFPLPLISRDLGFRGAAFADAGSLWGLDNVGNQAGIQGEEFAIRASAGVGLIWASPFGPLRVNYAAPLAKEDYDKTQEFSFGFSSRF
ncbi:BamA/TamA family outer membrane protein [Aureimonas sp. AU20]|uniref:BamA/TamA family outer membrane protein n=1 Tax=Aureimonas sp. AU20 TaxID=1349819 RepID=UPI00244EC609|nr:BamA/TamA family outer membrane protein [Aureimonas sp. AU20]